MRLPLVIVGMVCVIALAVVLFMRDGNKTTLLPSAQLNTPVSLPDFIPAGVPSLPAALNGDGPLVVWSAHAGARLEPCGCVAGMHGGLVRRASLVARIPAARRLVLECGGWSGGAADYQQLRTTTYLRALQQTGQSVVGIGSAEIKLGAKILANLMNGNDLPKIVCANVAKTDGTPIGERSVQIEKLGQVFIVTSVAPASASGEGLTVSDPEQAILKIIAQFPKMSVVVMADMDENALLALARAVPGISLLVGGAVAGPSPQPLAVGATRIVHVANEGKTIGYWPWGSNACHYDLVDDKIPDHPLVRTAIGSYQELLGSMDLVIDERLAGMTTLQRDDTARYVGNNTCLVCHVTAHTGHAKSKHAHAYETLVKKGYHHDPDCLRCHVVGPGLPDGFKRRGESLAQREPIQRDLAQVGCESCHGRGSTHVAERTSGRISSGSLQPVTPATCQRCHDLENSPRFNYDTYWERIRHGR
jgi:hypothetical protein